MLKIIFAGTPEFAATHLQTLLQSSHQIVAVYTQPDRPAGRGQKLLQSAVKQLALQHALPIYQPATLRDPIEQEKLKNLHADVMVVVAYGLLLPEPILNAPRYGCINVHASLLPRWRGAAPIQRAIIAGDAETGITIMQMDKGLDTGSMLHQVSCAITAEDTAETLHNKLAVLGASALLETLNELEQGKLSPIAQDNTLACYAAKIEKSEAKLNWQLSANELARDVRAFNPWPIAFTQIDMNIALRIWHARVLSESTKSEPGTIVRINKEGIAVATADGILLLEKIQLPGGRPISGTDFLNAKRDCLQVGQKFL
jgi:methionyl-tRNA formyltransferase